MLVVVHLSQTTTWVSLHIGELGSSLHCLPANVPLGQQHQVVAQGVGSTAFLIETEFESQVCDDSLDQTQLLQGFGK